MMTSHCSHCSYNGVTYGSALQAMLRTFARATCAKFLRKTLRASYPNNGVLRTIVEPDPDMAICRALCRSEPDDDVMGLDCSW